MEDYQTNSELKSMNLTYLPVKSQLDFWPDEISEKRTSVEWAALHYFRRLSGLMILPFLLDYLRDLTTFS